MKFFLDENFPKSASKYLQASGHQTIDIRGSDNEGLDDLSIFNLAQDQSAVFLTTDRDFFHTVPFYFQKHFGVIVVALDQPNRTKILHKLDWVFENIDMHNIANKIILLRDNNYTIRE